MMTTVTTLAALLPVLLSTGRGADVARAMALPVFGGMLIEPFTTFIVPTLYCAYVEFKMKAGLQDQYFADKPTANDQKVERLAASRRQPIAEPSFDGSYPKP